MSEKIPETSLLRQLFRSAVDRAFAERREIYSPWVARHLTDEVLCEFVHVDRVFRLRDAAGRRLEEIPRMLGVSTAKEGPERRLEVDAYIGDFALFMGGFFASSLRRKHGSGGSPMVSRVGKILVSFGEALDYYAAEGRNAYERAAATARIVAPDVGETYTLLASEFEGYRRLLGRVKEIIVAEPPARDIEGLAE